MSKKILIFVSAMLFHPMLSPSSFAWAKRKTPPKAFSFIVEGGKASQGECDGERKIPQGLKHLKEFAKISSYMGSELQSPEIKGKSNEEMWKHFFRMKDLCNKALSKTPSAVADASLKNGKAELPPEDSVESDDDADQTGGPDSE